MSLYKSVVVVVAIAAVAVAALVSGISDWTVVGFLAVLLFIIEARAFPLPVLGSGSLAFTLVFAAALLDGPLAAALVALAGAITRQDIEQRKPLLTMAFNAGQLALMGVAGGMLLGALGQTPLLRAQQSSSVSFAWLLASMLVAFVMACLNVGLVGLAISMIQGAPLIQVWRESFRDYVLSMLALALLGLVLAELIATSGIPGTLLLVVPFAVAWQTFRVYQEQSEAYRSTVRCLVAAIEAKDPYTRGHSERVAWYAREIAEELGLPEHEVQKIEWAALLHDVGKVAIAKSTLTKPSRLTHEEHVAVKEHPSVAAKILEEIDFLADAIPYVEAHHERLDGHGYPLGLRGEDVPAGARILAVADCFDAMTSQRAYRSAMSYGQAVAELQTASGAQLDQACVVALLARVDEPGLVRILASGGADDEA